MTSLFWRIRGLLLASKWYVRPVWHPLHLCYRIIMVLYGASISLKTENKGTPILIHGLHGVFISSRAVIGKNVTIYQQVTIGSISEGSRKGAPVIEDDVLIGPGARVLGDTRVGKGARITANCVVVHDVPEYALVKAPKPEVIVRSQ